MSPAVAKRLRLLASAVSILILLIAIVAIWFYWRVGQSRARLDGETHLPGLSAAVTVERDSLGVPTVRAASRTDASRALGFLHAQERFFQMDLSRRRSAGELSELFGKAALDFDRFARLHGFRRIAQTVLSRISEAERKLVEAYTEGVNSGLAQLPSSPFEYVLLGTAPAAWKAEDSVLVIFTMTIDLQSATGNYEQSLSCARDLLGDATVDFFAPLIGPNDAALDGSSAPLRPMPTERQLDLRKRVTGGIRDSPLAMPGSEPEAVPGSNCFALGGAHSGSGGGLLANDMHLGLRVPNVWYRASLEWPDAAAKVPTVRRVTGVTLPGTPVMVAGSNGYIAWGFTNSEVDSSDLVLVSLTTVDSDVYSNQTDLIAIEQRSESIAVKGEKPEVFKTKHTIWGPIVGKTVRERPLAMKWMAHDPDATNFVLVELETANTVGEAIAVAHRSGIPAQNFTVVDRDGNAGWTIAGKLPKRVGFDGRTPSSWAYGDRRWEGFLPSDEIPSVRYRPGDAASNGARIWSANQRMIGGAGLSLLGDGGYERPFRAARSRELLLGLDKAEPKDLLAVQLDERAPHLDRWQRLLMSVLGEEAMRADKKRGELRTAVQSWEGRATVDSVSYRLVRGFRREVIKLILDPLFEPCREAYPFFSYSRFHYESALWQLIETKPAHLLNVRFSTWDDLLLAACDSVRKELEAQHTPVAAARWGTRHTVRISHPFTRVFPVLGAWLDMPVPPLPGDVDVPRVQTIDHGASERFVVSPGRENEGIYHMPGGQSGNPRSPFYRAGHEAWVRGEASPFLPGPAKHTLTLKP